MDPIKTARNLAGSMSGAKYLPYKVCLSHRQTPMSFVNAIMDPFRIVSPYKIRLVHSKLRISLATPTGLDGRLTLMRIRIHSVGAHLQHTVTKIDPSTAAQRRLGGGSVHVAESCLQRAKQQDARYSMGGSEPHGI